ncbi:hypothetical protein EDD11_002580 [Mortierella claussenii]|nr:hypothetical protein EDD11_002580 [Mortierella claussenii]
MPSLWYMVLQAQYCLGIVRASATDFALKLGVNDFGSSIDARLSTRFSRAGAGVSTDVGAVAKTSAEASAAAGAGDCAGTNAGASAGAKAISKLITFAATSRLGSEKTIALMADTMASGE